MLALAVPAVLASAATAADHSKTVRGRIQEVNPSAHQLRIATDEGQELTLRVDNSARLARECNEVGLDMFQKGMRVKVVVESNDGGQRVVSMTPTAVTAEELRNEFRNALQAARSYTFGHKDEYRQRLQRLLQKVEERIDQLQAQAAQAGEEARPRLAQQIERRRRLRDKVQAQAERVKAATPGAWEDIKAGLGAALDDLRKGFENAGRHFR
jgi:hypothetical protein